MEIFNISKHINVAIQKKVHEKDWHKFFQIIKASHTEKRETIPLDTVKALT